MNYTVPTSILAITVSLSAFFLSCQKSGKCPDPILVTIEYTTPVIEGWPLQLEVSTGTDYRFEWSGPNGWTQDDATISGDGNVQVRKNITLADAGEYKVRVINDQGCVEYAGSIAVEVIAPPTPPCTISANSSTSSVVGVGGYSFGYRNFSSGGGGHYFVEGAEGGASGGGDFMRFAFLGNDPPLPGIYKTSGYFGNEAGKVGLFVGSGAYEFVANPDQTVYVNKVNNKLQVAFCGILFNNPLSPANPITISAKISQ